MSSDRSVACSTTCSCRSSSSEAGATRTPTTSRSTDAVAIETRRFDSVEAFLDVCGSFLGAREPEHQLTLGIVGDAQARGGFPEDGALVGQIRSALPKARELSGKNFQALAG